MTAPGVACQPEPPEPMMMLLRTAWLIVAALVWPGVTLARWAEEQTMELDVGVAIAAAIIAAAGVLVALISREAVSKSGDRAERAERSARYAAGRVRAMTEHRIPLEVLLQEWGLPQRRAVQLAAEIRDKVAQEVGVTERVGQAGSMRSAAAESIGSRYRLPRDGGPPLTSVDESGGPQGTRRAQ